LVALGLSIFALSRVLAIHYIQQNVDEPEILARAKDALWFNALLFLIVFIYWLIKLLFIGGFSYDPDTMIVTKENFKYLHNIIEMPLNTVLLLSGIGLVLYGIMMSLFRNFQNAIWYSGTGTVLTVFALFILAGFNRTCFYPSLTDTQSSLNIQNASSSHYTLTVMSYVSLLVPFVFAYIFYAWRSINNKKIDKQEMESETHIY
jgi:cytochrome d ubiquinol oxidase subunit II